MRTLLLYLMFVLAACNENDPNSTQKEIDELKGQIAALKLEIKTIKQSVSEKPSGTSDDLTYLRTLQTVMKIDGSEIIFDGVNVHIQSGRGATNKNTNGKGNLIIGYNEESENSVRTGSHNLIVGPGHNYASYGGVLFGSENTVETPYGSVLGGADNRVTGDRGGSILGGQSNVASNDSIVGGGFKNSAIGLGSAVLGGTENSLTGIFDVMPQ